MIKRISLIMISLILVFGLTAFASPYSVSLNDYGNSYDLVTVTNPTKSSFSTYDKIQNISGYALEGVSLALYMSDGVSYKLIYKDGYPLSWTAGASGMFIKPIALSHGKNNILLRATYGEKVQNVRMEIIILSSNFLNLIRGFSFN